MSICLRQTVIIPHVPVMKVRELMLTPGCIINAECVYAMNCQRQLISRMKVPAHDRGDVGFLRGDHGGCSRPYLMEEYPTLHPA